MEKLYDWMNKDRLQAVIVDGSVFWFEKTSRLYPMPNYIHDILVKWGENRGLIYLYNLPEK